MGIAVDGTSRPEARTRLAPDLLLVNQQHPEYNTDQKTRLRRGVALLPAVLWGVLALWLGSDAGTDFLTMLAIVAGGFLVFVWWACLRLWHLFGRRQSPRSFAGGGRHWLFFWLAELLVVAIVVAALMVRLPFRMRFALSEAEFRKQVTSVQPGRQTPLPITLGTFRVTEMEVVDRGVVRLTTSRDGLLDKAGVVFSPDGRPPYLNEDTYTHL